MPPPSSHLSNTAKGGGVKRFCLSLRLSCRQAYFLPFPRPFIFSFPRRHRADHSAISLSDHVLGSHRRQHSKRFLILFLQQFLSPLRMLQGGLPHGAGVDLKAVMFLHSRGGVDKRVLTTKIGQHSLQTPGAASRTNANGLRQQTQVPLLVRAPDSLLYAERTKDTPPPQSFFLRTLAELSLAFNCSVSLRSVCAAQLSMLVLPKRRISSMSNPS